MNPLQSRKTDSYTLKKIQGTPFPNRLLEAVFTMPETQARIVCLIVRSTLGWQAGDPGKRKASVCLTHTQIKKRIGRRSSAAISRALEALVHRGLIEILSQEGELLATPEERRRYHRPLRYRIATAFVEGPRSMRGVDNPVDSES